MPRISFAREIFFRGGSYLQSPAIVQHAAAVVQYLCCRLGAGSDTKQVVDKDGQTKSVAICLEATLLPVS